MRLTAAQRHALSIAADHDTIAGSNHTCADQPCLNTSTAERLVVAGLLAITAWTGRVHIYAITPAGQAAAKEQAA